MSNALQSDLASTRVVVVDPLDCATLSALSERYDVKVALRPSRDELPSLLAEADVVVLRSGVELDGDLIRGAGRLRVIARAGMGVDNIDLEAARAAGVTVFTVPGASSTAVAELAVGLALAVMRRVTLADRQIRLGEWRKSELVGRELSSAVVGVVGLGSVGGRIAHLCNSFGSQVVATVARADERRRAAWHAAAVELYELDELLRRSDVVFVAVPLTTATRGLLNRPRLQLIGRSSYLVNVSRGGVLVEDDLIAALEAGELAGAGLDVFEREGDAGRLADLPGTVLTPHIGAMTAEAQRRVGETVLNSIHAALTGAAVPTRVA